MKTIEFEIISKENPQIHQNGYVEVPADEEEMPEWFYFDQYGMTQPRMFTHHDGIGISQIGATDEQEKELDEFLTQVQFDFVDWVDEVILLSEEDEHETYAKGDLIIKINDGAKMECEIKEDIAYRGDFVVEVIPKFNGRVIPLVKFMAQNDIQFDPWLVQEPQDCNVENGHIYFEMSKDYWEGDEQDKADRLNDVTEEAQLIFQAMLFSKIDFEDDMFEQSLDSNLCESDELFDLYLWSEGKMTAKEFADRNGYEWS